MAASTPRKRTSAFAEGAKRSEAGQATTRARAAKASEQAEATTPAKPRPAAGAKRKAKAATSAPAGAKATARKAKARKRTTVRQARSRRRGARIGGAGPPSQHPADPAVGERAPLGVVSDTPLVLAGPDRQAADRRRKLHRPHPVAKAVPSKKAVAKSGARSARPTHRPVSPRPDAQSGATSGPAPRAELKAVRDDVVPATVTPLPTARASHVALAPGVEELLRAGVAALRLGAESSGLFRRRSSGASPRSCRSCAAG